MLHYGIGHSVLQFSVSDIFVYDGNRENPFVCFHRFQHKKKVKVDPGLSWVWYSIRERTKNIMSKAIMKPSGSKQLPVHIVEQHNDVVPFIHRAIGSKLLPFSEIPMIHLDSHPDLLIPVHLDAATVFEPPQLYEALSIENWILPLTFAKHINHVVWVKPPWANQIKASEQSFSVGRCCQTDKLRLSCKENYFLTDGLFCAASDLRDAAECKLTVVELRPHDWEDLQPCNTTPNWSNQKKNTNPELKSCVKECTPTGNVLSSGDAKPIRSSQNNSDDDTDRKSQKQNISSSSSTKNTKTTDSPNMTECDGIPADKIEHSVFSNHPKWTDYLIDGVTTKPYILDIDLDFFSTKNPFLEIFGSEKEVLQRIFKCPPLTGSSDEDIETFTTLRQKQLEELEFLFTVLHEKWCKKDGGVVPSLQEVSSMSLADLTGIDEVKELDYFNAEDQKDLLSLCHSVLPAMRKREITLLQLFDFGCTLDDTELPHHVSTDAQTQALGSALQAVLARLPKPAVVTISRSSHDDYCPKDQVDTIEQMVLKILTDAYGSLHITKNFDE